MDPLQGAVSAFLNAVQGAQAAGAEVTAAPQAALAAFLGREVGLLFSGATADGLVFTLPSGQTVTAQGEFPFPAGTQLTARVTQVGDALRLQTLSAQPPAPPAILAPLLQGEAQALQARLTQPGPPAELEALVRLFRLLGGAAPEPPATPAGTPGAAPPPSAQTPAQAGQAPATAGQTPATAGQAPATAGQTPATAGQAPAQAGQAPATAGQAPATAGQAPATAGQAPATAGQAPATAGQAPATAGQAPAAAGLTPATAGQAPATAGQAPATAGQAPATAGQTPATAGQAPPQAAPPGGSPAGSAAPVSAPSVPVPSGMSAPRPGQPSEPGSAPAPQPSDPASVGSTPGSAAPSVATPAAAALAAELAPSLERLAEALPGVPHAGAAPDREALVALLRDLPEADLELLRTALTGRDAEPAQAQAALARAQAAAAHRPDLPPGAGEAVAQVLRHLLRAEPAGTGPAPRATQAAAAQGASQATSQAPAAPETWEAWLRAGLKTLADPSASPREAPFHAAQAREGTAFFELPLPWSPQTPLQLWVEGDRQGRGRDPRGEAGVTRVLLGMTFSNLGETRLGLAKGPEGLQVRVWAERPEALRAAQDGMEAELRTLGLPVDLKVLALDPGPGGVVPTLRSLVTGSTFQVLG